MGMPQQYGSNDDENETKPSAEEGLSPHRPVMIAATTSLAGVPAEYDWLRKRFGRQDQDWTVDLRSRGTDELGRMIETFRLSLGNGSRVEVHFDVTEFYQS